MARTEIFFYSGTGNSMHVAREISRRLPGSELVPMVKFFHQEGIRTDAETVGFVFPIYFTSVPAPVRAFIDALEMSSVKYTFVVATRIGTFTIARPLIESLLRKKRKLLDLFSLVNMASNSPTGLRPGKGDARWVEMTSEKEVSRMEGQVLSELDRVTASILMKECTNKRSIVHPLQFITYLLMDPLTRNIKSEVGYIVDDSCIGCGTCERVCLSGKVMMKEGRPIWRKEVRCYYCFACFNFCPQQAILVSKKYDRKDGRYHHPDISLQDITDQKA